MNRPSQAGAIGAATVGTGAALTAGIASACCVGPALAPIFVSVLGASGLVAVSGLRPYTPWLLIASAAMLGFSFLQTYRRPACATGGSASVSIGVRIARVVTWAAAALWLASTAYSIYGLVNE
ncbi:MAG TPA: mercuric transporter MerT family protein [Candidatus Cybelea sp.]|jgi:hypothetical protein